MRMIAPLPELETVAGTVLAARPTLVAHGVSVASWIQGGRFKPRFAMGFIASDANAAVIASPTGGAAGPELWTWRTAGTLAAAKWFLIGYLNGGVSVPVPGPATQGFSFLVDMSLVGERLAVAGTPDGHAQTYFFAPLEEQLHAHSA